MDDIKHPTDFPPLPLHVERYSIMGRKVSLAHSSASAVKKRSATSAI
ncbi:hypothetical protein [Burkholderia latens]|nr:hypothetical protein [Burkholderia latens]